MHEAGLMQQTLEIAFEHMHARQATRITRLKLSLGPLAGVVPDALRFAFEALSPDTPAENALLELVTIPVLCYCPTCDTDQTLEGLDYACPACGNTAVTIVRGTEFELTSMEVI